MRRVELGIRTSGVRRQLLVVAENDLGKTEDRRGRAAGKGRSDDRPEILLPVGLDSMLNRLRLKCFASSAMTDNSHVKSSENKDEFADWIHLKRVPIIIVSA